MKLTKRYRTKLKAAAHYRTAAFVQSLPEFFAALAAGIVAYKLLAFAVGETLLAVLKTMVFVLAAVFWGIRFYEHYTDIKSET